MNDTWIDLTDLFIWRGNLTGIQRVTYNYASRFDKEGARFFVYSATYLRFIEIPLNLIHKLKEQDAILGGWTKRQKLKRRLRQKYDRLPKLIQHVLKPILQRANRWFRILAAMIVDKDSREGLIRRMPRVEFAKGDTVVVLGAAWNSVQLIDRLAEQKQQHDLRIFIHLNDILPIYQPHLFAKELTKLFSPYVLKALSISDMVSVISDATKKDIIRYCKAIKLKIPEITVIRLGEDIAIKTPKRPNAYIEKDFILCVGTFEIRKNYFLIYQAVKLAELENVELPQIVIAGRRGWLTEDLHYVITHDPSTDEKINLLERVSDANLSWLYENCMFTVFPSVAEGWGLPIAESLQHGKFCLSSKTSSMPEVAGDRIDYFSPYDAGDCFRKIKFYVDKSRSAPNSFVKTAYRQYSWDDSYAKLKSLVERIKAS